MFRTSEGDPSWSTKEGGSDHQYRLDRVIDPSPNPIPDASTKAAIESFIWLREPGFAIKQGVCVNAVVPGPVCIPLIPSIMSEEKVETVRCSDIFLDAPPSPPNSLHSSSSSCERHQADHVRHRRSSTARQVARCRSEPTFKELIQLVAGTRSQKVKPASKRVIRAQLLEQRNLTYRFRLFHSLCKWRDLSTSPKLFLLWWQFTTHLIRGSESSSNFVRSAASSAASFRHRRSLGRRVDGMLGKGEFLWFLPSKSPVSTGHATNRPSALMLP